MEFILKKVLSSPQGMVRSSPMQMLNLALNINLCFNAYYYFTCLK